MELNINYLIQTFGLALKGIPTTLAITVISLLLAIPAAFFMAIAKIYKLPVLRQIVTVYTSFIRGTPMVLQILVIYSLLPSLLNILVKSVDLRFNIFDIDPIFYAFIVFSFNAMAGLSEVFRSALLTVHIGQIEAAQAIGLSTAQAYYRIVIPQALVVALPNICSLTINLIKGTSLAFLMSVKDITAIAKIQASYGYNYIESYLDILIIYIIICSITQGLFKIAEKRLGAFRLPAMA